MEILHGTQMRLTGALEDSFYLMDDVVMPRGLLLDLNGPHLLTHSLNTHSILQTINLCINL